MQLYKQQYNNLLKRYYNGCKYLKEHPEENEKFMPELLKILDKLNIILKEHPTKDNEEILNGFKK